MRFKAAAVDVRVVLVAEKRDTVGRRTVAVMVFHKVCSFLMVFHKVCLFLMLEKKKPSFFVSRP